MKQCVTVYLNAASATEKSLRAAATPFLEQTQKLLEEDEEGTGALQVHAASVLMKILYGARYMRWDMLKVVGDLAARITKWSLACDRKLLRLISYIHGTPDMQLVGWINDDPKDLRLDLYADADFAGDKKTMKSTSGCIIALTGPNTYMPLSAFSNRQTAVSHSTPEAEIVAADAAMRKEGLPFLQIWDVLLDRKTILTLYEDNSACLQILKTGKNPTLRHVQRTHHVSIKFCHERFYPEDPGVEHPQHKIRAVESEKQFADLFTKAFTKPLEWARVTANVGLRMPISRTRVAAGGG